jgi:hypothetical protein
MEKFIDCIMNLFDPLSPLEKDLEKRWQIRLEKIQKQMQNETI